MHERESVYEDPLWEAIELEYEDLSISKSIVARGQFGASYMLGRIRGSKPLPSKIDPITMIKSCDNCEQDNCFNGLRAELNILYDLSHTNVIKLIGYCWQEEEGGGVCRKYLVFEFCSNGNLIKVLQKGRPYFNSGTYSPKKAINNEILSPGIFLNFCGWHLLRWATEIARGMEYLAFKGVVHGDLAARNVLLTCDWNAKICNFGIAQRLNIQQDSYATQLDKQVLPIAWMAPETIKDMVYTERSDVFSYAITVWEIYAVGEIPYHGKMEPTPTFCDMLKENVRPEKPIHSDENIWKLVQSCWSYEPESRPTFSKIKTCLDRMVLATRSQWGSTLSGHICHSTGTDSDDCSSSRMTQTSKIRNKHVSFAPQPQTATGGFFRKCFCAADHVFFCNHAI